MRRLAIICLFLAAILHVGPSCADSVLSWVSLKSTEGGALSACIGNGSADDTACIQAHIDYAVAQHLPGIYCPAGTYKISDTIYLDPPGNLRTSFPVPTMFQFTMAFFGDPKGAGALPLSASPPCVLQATFGDKCAFIVGPGQGMKVSDIGVLGDNSPYRGNYNSAGCGIGIASGGGGASNTVIRDTTVRYFYSLYETGANGGCCLSDSNMFDHVTGFDGYIGIFLNGTQSFINTIISPDFGGVTISLDNEYSHQTQVIGGTFSTNFSASAALAISGAAASNCGSYTLCLTAVVTSPDANIPSVYDSYTMLTPHFGLIPFQMTGWNADTSTISLKALDSWETSNYGGNSYWSNNDIYSELDAVTTLYAAERLRVIKGVGVELDGTHIENDQACTTLLETAAVFAGQASTVIRNPFFDYNVSLPQNATPANKYCQQAFPFIDETQAGANSLELSGGNWTPRSGDTAYPILVDAVPTARISGANLNSFGLFNFRLYDTAGRSYWQENTTDFLLATNPRGIGTWDTDYFLPWTLWWNADAAAVTQWKAGELAGPFCGYEPCQSTTPNLTPALYSLVSGTLGALGTYPPIACRTVFKSVGWDMAAVTPPSTVGGGIFKRSASCPGWSWGQNLTDATVGHTVTWSYKRGSADLYLDANTMAWIFPGLGFTLDNGEGAQPYSVTGVYPYLGYATVTWAGNNTGNAGGSSVGLQGGTDRVYSCTASCTIGQAAYSWASY